MTTLSTEERRERLRNLALIGCPASWPQWPFLPLVRRRPGREEECGLLCDLMRLSGLSGYSATVFQENLFLVPLELGRFLALPREVFDTPEEAHDAGWRVD
jgi:hypothetical protein